MPPTATQPSTERQAEANGKGGGKARLLTLDDLDKRTKAAQRALELRDRLISERGGAGNMSVLKLAMVESVAVLTAMVESASVRWLRGESVDLAGLTSLLNARRREAQLVGLDIEPRDVTPLSEYIAQRAAEKATGGASAT